MSALHDIANDEYMFIALLNVSEPITACATDSNNVYIAHRKYISSLADSNLDTYLSHKFAHFNGLSYGMTVGSVYSNLYLTISSTMTVYSYSLTSSSYSYISTVSYPSGIVVNKNETKLHISTTHGYLYAINIYNQSTFGAPYLIAGQGN